MKDEIERKEWPGRTFFLAFSAVLAIASLLCIAVLGFNFGIDFTGGTILERRFETPVTVSDVRAVLEGDPLADLGLSSAVIQIIDDPRDVLIRIPALEGMEIDRIDASLTEAFGSIDILRTEFVGPVIGEELIRRAIWALLLSLVGVLIYLSFRFEFLYGIVAIIAVAFDALIVLGLVALLQRELDSAFIAAILTVVGYSLNDTIVIFDRVRENFRFRKRESVAEIVGMSVRQSVTRSINTSVTTLFTVGALLLFGGVSIRDFSLVLAAGIIVGTYSSLFLASHLYTVLRERDEARRGRGREVKLATKSAGSTP